jgi:V/A-type H+-transporting ATPase subunit D
MSAEASTDRAARLRLQSRLDLTGQAIELLHSKEEALQREAIRLRGHARRAAADWAEGTAAATTWLLRARALGAGPGPDGPSRPQEPATVTLDWRHSMGVTYPGSLSCRPGTGTPPVATAALGPAARAFAEALRAGAASASAGEALRRVESELAATRRRRRALERRLQPRLRARLHRLDLALDERERAAALRTRLATRTPTRDREGRT